MDKESLSERDICLKFIKRATIMAGLDRERKFIVKLDLQKRISY